MNVSLRHIWLPSDDVVKSHYKENYTNELQSMHVIDVQMLIMPQNVCLRKTDDFTWDPSSGIVSHKRLFWSALLIFVSRAENRERVK